MNLEQTIKELQVRNRKMVEPYAEPIDEKTHFYTIDNTVINMLTTDTAHAVALAVIGEMIELSDRIEQQEPDGGTRQWMAFKRFRNTMRDHLTTLEAKIKEK